MNVPDLLFMSGASFLVVPATSRGVTVCARVAQLREEHVERAEQLLGRRGRFLAECMRARFKTTLHILERLCVFSFSVYLFIYKVRLGLETL